MPPDGGRYFRGEGVAVVLPGRARRAWQDGGSQWTAISSRLVVARLGMAKVDGESNWLYVIVCYAPFFCAPRIMKDNFLTDVQELLRSVPFSERFEIPGDFNARVASRSGPDDGWGNVLVLMALVNVILLARNYYPSSI